jgi:hypothetical protein
MAFTYNSALFLKIIFQIWLKITHSCLNYFMFKPFSFNSFDIIPVFRCVFKQTKKSGWVFYNSAHTLQKDKNCVHAKCEISTYPSCQIMCSNTASVPLT